MVVTCCKRSRVTESLVLSTLKFWPSRLPGRALGCGASHGPDRSFQHERVVRDVGLERDEAVDRVVDVLYEESLCCRRWQRIFPRLACTFAEPTL